MRIPLCVRYPGQFGTRFDERAIALFAAFAFCLRVVLFRNVVCHAEYAFDFRAGSAVGFAARSKPQALPILELDWKVQFERHALMQAAGQLAREPGAMTLGDSVEQPLQRHFRLLGIETVDLRQLSADSRRAAAHVPFPRADTRRVEREAQTPFADLVGFAGLHEVVDVHRDAACAGHDARVVEDRPYAQFVPAVFAVETLQARIHLHALAIGKRGAPCVVHFLDVAFENELVPVQRCIGCERIAEICAAGKVGVGDDSARFRGPHQSRNLIGNIVVAHCVINRTVRTASRRTSARIQVRLKRRPARATRS